jgi:hypothetical protein
MGSDESATIIANTKYRGVLLVIIVYLFFFTNGKITKKFGLTLDFSLL